MISYCVNAAAQNVETDSLKKQLAVITDDRKRVSVLENLSYAYLSSYPDTALQYALQGLQLSKDIDFLKGEAICINAIGNVYFSIGDNAKALEMFLHYLRLKEQLKENNNISVAYFNMASVYTEDKDYRHALHYLVKAKHEDEKAKDSSAILYDLYSLGSIYLRMEKKDSALYYMQQCYKLVQQLDDKNMIGAVLNTYGEIYLALNNIPQAAAYFKQSLPYAEAVKDHEVITANYYGLAKIYKQKQMLDSSVYYARKAFNIAYSAPFLKQALETSSFISSVFKLKNKYDSAFHYQELSIAIKDSLFNAEQVKKVQNLKFEELQRQQLVETEKIKYHNNIKLFIVISISVIILIIAILLWRTNKQKQQANILLTEQKEKVEAALAELRSAQAQLIQSEKMASLGELTAGIAHEIQNPLNFVNNFSELNRELIEELKIEKHKQQAERNTAIEEEVLHDIDKNLEKIAFHGKRADAIVKSMLLHSRKHTGTKEPADINALVDEYLHLAYHGLRAKHKNFHAELKTNFDERLFAGNADAGTINVVPGDIGRALLNIFNNAFYAVKHNNSINNEHYKPAVCVTTQKLNADAFNGAGGVEIIISDNGHGIPKDIIAKEHKGTIKVESKEGEGTEFKILIAANY